MLKSLYPEGKFPVIHSEVRLSMLSIHKFKLILFQLQKCICTIKLSVHMSNNPYYIKVPVHQETEPEQCCDKTFSVLLLFWHVVAWLTWAAMGEHPRSSEIGAAATANARCLGPVFEVWGSVREVRAVRALYLTVWEPHCTSAALAITRGRHT